MKRHYRYDCLTDFVVVFIVVAIVVVYRDGMTLAFMVHVKSQLQTSMKWPMRESY